jgi:ribosomal protein S12 methylthiotransferase accessory factor YcaO
MVGLSQTRMRAVGEVLERHAAPHRSWRRRSSTILISVILDEPTSGLDPDWLSRGEGFDSGIWRGAARR